MGSTLLGLLVLEGVARLGFLPSKVFTSHHSMFCEHDSIIGWRHKPNFAGLFTQTEVEITLRFNSQGIRGPEYPFSKPAGEYRIAILGDSFAEGYTVEFEELFSQVLKQNLTEQTGQPIEVINFGVGGYSTDQELLQYQQKVKKYSPDLTIIMFHDNDIWYNNQAYYGAWGRGRKPLFRIENGNLTLTNTPVPLPIRRPRRFSEKVKTAFHKHSHLYRWTTDRIKSSGLLYSLAVSLKIAELPYSAEEGLIPEEYGIFRETYSPEVLAAWEVTEALLKKLKEETDADGSELLIFYVPQKAVVYGDLWEQMAEYYNLGEGGGWSKERVAQVLTEVLERLDIMFINPVEQMRQLEDDATDNGGRLYFQYDGHWNNKGNQFVGEILADYIIANFLRPGGS